VFRPSLIDIWANADPTPLLRPAAGVDRARPVAASVDVSADIGRTPLPYANVDVDVRRPGSAAGPRLLEPATSMFVGAPSAHLGSLDVASSRTRMSSDTPMPLSDVGQRGLARPMRINMPRPLDLTLPIASDVAYTLPSSDVDVAGPTYGPATLTGILSNTRDFGMPILQNNSESLPVIVFDRTFRMGIANGQPELRQESINTYLLPRLLRCKSLPNTSISKCSKAYPLICMFPNGAFSAVCFGLTNPYSSGRVSSL